LEKRTGKSKINFPDGTPPGKTHRDRMTGKRVSLTGNTHNTQGKRKHETENAHFSHF
jgi:hypothetical protein